MDEFEFQMLAKNEVTRYVRKTLGFNEAFEVYIVWMCKTLQNNKALLSTSIEDGRYYEVTYNGDKRAVYLDAYKKEKNISHVGIM